MVAIPEVDERARDLCEVLGCDGRDFLIRSNGDEVKISSLKGKTTVVIYLCGYELEWDIFYRNSGLVQLYRDDFEVVMVPMGEDEEFFNTRLARTQCLAVPHADSDAVRSRVVDITRNQSDEGKLIVVDDSGKILIRCSSHAVRFYGSERIFFLYQREAVAKLNQSITSLLGDHLISGTTREVVPVSQLVGKTVGLFFQNRSPDHDFTDLLLRVYNQLRDGGEEFEVVFVPRVNKQNEEELHGVIGSMPWLALQSRSKHAEKLWYYNSENPNLPKPTGITPSVFIISPDGKTLNVDGARLIRMYGADAFPFTSQRLEKLEIEEKQRPLTLETLLAFHGRDFVIRKDGSKVGVERLVGKTVMFYLGDYVSRKQLESFRGIREKDDAFEVVWIGIEHTTLDLIEDWMFALPPGDVRELRVLCMLHQMAATFPYRDALYGILLDSSCRIVRADCDEIISVYGADAYPFTQDHLERLERRAEEIASSWPDKVRHEIHQHEIDRVVCDEYDCDGCYWLKCPVNFRCTHCGGFDLHLHFAFGEDNGEGKPDGRELMSSFITKMTSLDVN